MSNGNKAPLKEFYVFYFNDDKEVVSILYNAKSKDKARTLFKKHYPNADLLGVVYSRDLEEDKK